MAFKQTTLEIVLRPAKFYRTLNVRGPVEPAIKFSRLHWLIAGTLFGVTGATHTVWYSFDMAGWAIDFPGGRWALFAVLIVVLSVLSVIGLEMLTRIAAWLTNKEATYRGLRLPYNVVLRGMCYHAAHYLPVALAAVLVVEGFQLLDLFMHRMLPFNASTIYLYVLCGLVVSCAIYLFQTYWISMRNMMYANR